MGKDFSLRLADKYFSLTSKEVFITLKSGRNVYGVVFGFSKGEKYSNEPFITRWHITDLGDEMAMGRDAFGLRIGEIIEQTDIVEVYFYEDCSVITDNEYLNH